MHIVVHKTRVIQHFNVFMIHQITLLTTLQMSAKRFCVLSSAGVLESGSACKDEYKCVF